MKKANFSSQFHHEGCPHQCIMNLWIHFIWWGEASWVEGVSPGPHKINEGCPHRLLNKMCVYIHMLICIFTCVCIIGRTRLNVLLGPTKEYMLHAMTIWPQSHRTKHTNLDFVGQYALFILHIFVIHFTQLRYLAWQPNNEKKPMCT